jgi:thiol:disulfide interchange protein DsbC
MWRCLVCIVFLLVVSGLVSATPGTAPASVPETQQNDGLRKTLERLYPDSAIESVRPSVLQGLYEITTRNEIIYSDAAGRFLIAGSIIDTATKENITARAWDEHQAIDFASLPFDRAIRIVKGNGQRQVAIFADPHCPYCLKLEQNLSDVTDLTVFIFLYPLEDLHPGATERAQAIWCSKDRSSTWTKWMLEHAAPSGVAGRACPEDPTGDIRALAERLNIVATPTLFFSDGHRHAGVLSASDINVQLSLTYAAHRPSGEEAHPVVRR